MDDVIFFLKGTVFTIPFLVIQAIGLVLPLFFRSRLPRVWGAAMISFFLLLIGNLSWLVYYALFIWVFSKAKDYETADKVAIVQGIFHSVTGFFGYVLLLVALLRRREAQEG